MQRVVHCSSFHLRFGAAEHLTIFCQGAQLLLTTHDISSLNDTNTQVDIGVLDFSKAFDVVPQRLLNKRARAI